MRGGLERWKRGVDSRGVRHAISYALEGTCDSHLHHSTGVDALETYADGKDANVPRFIVEAGVITRDVLNAGGLRVWLTGHDPITGEDRGRQRLSADADLVLDGTINHPKSYSIAALLYPDLASEFEALQDRLRDRVLTTWQATLNARRGHNGLIREELHRIEVVELLHRRSRALDPHIHRHLWLNVKVRGIDGRWSNIDSRVAMRLHTVINAEGELAARTGPAWIRALSRHGYTLNQSGEIAQLDAVVRPLSRRSAQIEANRAQLTAEWSAAHKGMAPSVEALMQIDRRAWAVARPDKPALVDEGEWEKAILDEIVHVDPSLAVARPAIAVLETSLADIDRDHLAAAAIADADKRSASSGARFSMFDLRAGALRALARSGIVASRDELDTAIEEITARARSHALSLVGEDVPAHAKCLMATETMREKIRLVGQLDALAKPGRTLLPGELRLHANKEEVRRLDGSQITAACALAGTNGVVAVSGPAGTGKTTMLRVAYQVSSTRGQRMLVVAPTRKAASVVSREVGCASTSIHSLLLDHGFRWIADVTGAVVWSRLTPGDVDPVTHEVYRGPVRFALRPKDQIVVDEAGMVDLQTANVLAALALELRVRLALVGDPQQAMPVGHAGAMAAAIRYANASVELDVVHRFRDPDYGAITLSLRSPRDREHAAEIAALLHRRGHLERVDDHIAAQERMVDEYFNWHLRGKRIAIVTGTNVEADAINAMIQERRVDAGDLNAGAVVWGKDQQRILVGDTVQTRRNDPRTGVENRAVWIVANILDGDVDLVSAGDSGERKRITRDYALDHLQLAYASTVHGVQGETADASIVGPGVDAAGLYVGLTRGRIHNLAVAIAPNDAAACSHVADSMLRGTVEITMQDAVQAAEAEIRLAARSRPTEWTGPVVGASSATPYLGR